MILANMFEGAAPLHYHLIRYAIMDLPTFLARSPSLESYPSLDEFSSRWEHQRFEKGGHLSRQQEPEMGEFILLSGCLASTILGHDGTEICVGLFVGPCVVTPYPSGHPALTGDRVC